MNLVTFASVYSGSYVLSEHANLKSVTLLAKLFRASALVKKIANRLRSKQGK